MGLEAEALLLARRRASPCKHFDRRKPPPGVRFFQTGVRRRKTNEAQRSICTSNSGTHAWLIRVFISSSTPSLKETQYGGWFPTSKRTAFANCFQLLLASSNCFLLLRTAFCFFELLFASSNCFLLLLLRTAFCFFELLFASSNCFLLLRTAFCFFFFELLFASSNCFLLLRTAFCFFELLFASSNCFLLLRTAFCFFVLLVHLSARESAPGEENK
jgi:hypothetical protein